jgi:hypothetical protein
VGAVAAAAAQTPLLAAPPSPVFLSLKGDGEASGGGRRWGEASGWGRRGEVSGEKENESGRRERGRDQRATCRCKEPATTAWVGGDVLSDEGIRERPFVNYSVVEIMGRLH